MYDPQEIEQQPDLVPFAFPGVTSAFFFTLFGAFFCSEAGDFAAFALFSSFFQNSNAFAAFDFVLAI